MRISNQLLQKYAELIVRTGANVQKDQVVQLTVSVEQHAFAAMVIASVITFFLHFPADETASSENG